jgi:hypothetical protein
MNIVITEKEPLDDESPIKSDSPHLIDHSLANQIHYSLNYTLPMLQHICGFYEIPYKRIKKKDLIISLVTFESNPEHIEIVEDRKRLWFYMEELKANKYLSKYIISM